MTNTHTQETVTIEGHTFPVAENDSTDTGWNVRGQGWHDRRGSRETDGLVVLVLDDGTGWSTQVEGTEGGPWYVLVAEECGCDQWSTQCATLTEAMAAAVGDLDGWRLCLTTHDGRAAYVINDSGFVSLPVGMAPIIWPPTPGRAPAENQAWIGEDGTIYIPGNYRSWPEDNTDDDGNPSGWWVNARTGQRTNPLDGMAY